MKLGEYAESVTAFEEALELAEEQNDKPAVEAITKAIKDVNDKILDAQSKGDTTGIGVGFTYACM